MRMNHYFSSLVCAAFIVLPVISGTAWSKDEDFALRVLKVVVTRADGTQELGSAVPLVGARVVTNCHVVRNAVRIEIVQAGITRQAKTSQRDAYRDLCFLMVPGFESPPIPMVELGQTWVGLDVIAVGYPGGRYAATRGKIVGLHRCECDGGKVIQTSAPFDHGASGGGLLDRQGRLVGILSFKNKSGGNFHFALPVGWLRHLAERNIEPIRDGNPFWEKPGKESSYFLAACDLGAKKNWRSLSRLSNEWVEQEPNNPEAWMALGRAHLGLNKDEAAARAFQTVLMLDSTHAEAQWSLQQLEFELGRNLLETSAGI